MPVMQNDRPDETTFGLAPDQGKEPAMRGKRMGFLDEDRPDYLPPDRDHSEVTETGAGSMLASPATHTRNVAGNAHKRVLNIFGE